MTAGIDAPWARRPDVGFVALERVQRGLTVDSIMTPRSRLMTCRRDDSARAVMARNTDRYSHLPVLDESDIILGLYRAEQWFGEEAPERPVGADYEPLSEALVIGADTPIVEFLKTADDRPTKLVVSGDRVAGLVGLSDLQQLPVRAALFTLIASLEIAMANWIEAKWPDDSGSWLAILSPGRRTKVLEKIQQFKDNDSFVGDILCTDFKDKCAIVLKQRLIPASQRQMERDFSAIRDLRDQLAHASLYAETPQAAIEVCSVVRRILEIRRHLADAIGKT